MPAYPITVADMEGPTPKHLPLYILVGVAMGLIGPLYTRVKASGRWGVRVW